MEHHDQALLKNLLADPSFENWVKKTNKNDVLFWNKWISNHPDKIKTVDTAKLIILGISFNKNEVSEQKMDLELAGVLKKIKKTKVVRLKSRIRRPSPTFWKLGVAAAMLLLFGMVAFLNRSTEVNHKTGYGEIIELKLLDGTLVTLNGNSEIRYDKKNSRNITLKGEAYFKVKPIPSSNAKFWVNTQDLRVQVYGTQFHVNTRDKKTKVLLDEGSIHLLLKNGGSRKMVPGEFVSFSKDKNLVTHEKVNKELQYALWRESTYIFNNINLKEVMKYVEHTYGLPSEFVDKGLEQTTITGGIPNHDLNICLSAIEKSTGTRIVLKDKRLLIIKDN